MDSNNHVIQPYIYSTYTNAIVDLLHFNDHKIHTTRNMILSDMYIKRLILASSCSDRLEYKNDTCRLLKPSVVDWAYTDNKFHCWQYVWLSLISHLCPMV